MSQNDFIIADAVTPTVRADINAAFAAIVTQSSGVSAPSPTYANMMWYDTSNNLLKMRSELDDAWITIGSLDQTTNTFIPAGVLDEDDMVSDDPLRPPSQQSVAAYVTTEIAAIPSSGYTELFSSRTLSGTGSSDSVTSLDLTSYTTLMVLYEGMSITTADTILLNGVTVNGTAASLNYTTTVWVNLINGQGFTTTTNSNQSATGIVHVKLPVTTATTSLTTSANSGTFDEGTWKAYAI